MCVRISARTRSRREADRLLSGVRVRPRGSYRVRTRRLHSLLSCSRFVWHTRRMNPPPAPTPYKRHRFPAVIVSHGVWLYFRFCLSYRDVQELMAERGVILTYKTVRYWCRKFGRPTPISCAAGVLGLGTRGIWMKSFSPSTAPVTTCGAPSIRMAMASISWCNAGAPRRPRSASSANSSRV
jgi:hypothetical protein